MGEALREAELAFDEGEVPVGAVVVRNGRIIGKGHNRREALQDPTAHAEMLAVSAAANTIGSWRLRNVTLYVTLEPCAMCAGALFNARIPTLVFGTFDADAGACGSAFNLIDKGHLNHRVKVVSGVLEDRCGALLKEFFGALRKDDQVHRISREAEMG